jgi:radical SAM superfamily enzyme YgiQ (UPF0313 family)
MADVVLISFESGFLPSYGLLNLESFLRQEGIETRLMYPLIHREGFSSLAEKVAALKPRVVGIGGLFGDRHTIRDIIKSLGLFRGSFRIVVGGNVVTPIPEFMLEKLGADIAVVGEGELIFRDIVKKILADRDFRDTKGIVFKDGNRFESTGPGEYIADLDKLPAPSYEMMPMEYFIEAYKFYRYSTRNSLFTPRTRLGTVYTGRGCPFKCNFCYHSAGVRLMSVPKVISEVTYLKDRFGINLLVFADDLAIINKKRAMDLCDGMIRHNVGLDYIVNAHFSCLDEEIVAALKTSGCVQVGLGLESGSQAVLDRIEKGVRVWQIRKGLDLLRKYGITWSGNIQIGQLDETMQDVRETVKLFYPYVDRLSTVTVGITTPYPGTPLYYLGLRNGIIKSAESVYIKLKDLRSLVFNFSKIPAWKLRLLRIKLSICFDLKKMEAMYGPLLGYVHIIRAIFKRSIEKLTRILCR